MAMNLRIVKREIGYYVLLLVIDNIYSHSQECFKPRTSIRRVRI